MMSILEKVLWDIKADAVSLLENFFFSKVKGYMAQISEIWEKESAQTEMLLLNVFPANPNVS